MYSSLNHEAVIAAPSADPEGGQGVRTPSGKSQIKWVSIGNKQLDTSWIKLDPPGKNWTDAKYVKLVYEMMLNDLNL